MTTVDGIIVSAGIAFGQALTIRSNIHPLDLSVIPANKVELEKDKLLRAVNNLISYLLRCQGCLTGQCDNFQLIEADIALLEDSEMHQELYQHIGEYRVSASVAVDRIFKKQAREMAQLEDPYLANRSNDILGLAKRLNSALHGHLQWDLSSLEHDTILLADDLTPAEFAILPFEHIKGIVLESGGLTSHTAILARTAGIPALLNCSFTEHEQVKDGTEVILDAIDGRLIIAPTPHMHQALTSKRDEEIARHLALEKFKPLAAKTQDGHCVKLMANIGSLNDISKINDVGAQGVGLFRTEFILMYSSSMPDEKQQYQIYCDALHGIDNQVLTIRTFDIGADKDIPWLGLQNEDNPALGLRGIRYSLSQPESFLIQVKAILRAANHGSIRLMFPMVCQVEELEQVNQLIEQAKVQLQQQGKPFGQLQIGIVVETPASVLNLPSMLPLIDFVSIGTNDLTQYTLAADRTNPQLAKNYPPLSPAVIQLIRLTIEQCKSAGISVSLCGEIGSNPAMLPLLVGLGVDEISINPTNLLEVKATLVQGNYQAFVKHAKYVSQLSKINDVSRAIASYNKY
ncbi:phosphoenolpyruvate--protein phosphotransferase [Shewanella maritima]|uniref:phosphoenolpyruvate--protein phosphotransferase n=1 Tax=Shewanella maritima TaxID=2520507 RepID=UPI0037357FC1